MASDVIPPGLSSLAPNAAAPNIDLSEFMAEIDSIVNLRNEVLLGDNSRFKRPTSASNALTRPAPPPQANERGRLAPTPVAPAQNRESPTVSSAVPSESQIDNVLLTKSDVLIKAEMTLKRRRIEQELKQQLEHRKLEARLGIEVRDGRAVSDEDVDLEDAIAKAGVRIKPIARPDSANKLHGKSENPVNQNGYEAGVDEPMERRTGAEGRFDQHDEPSVKNVVEPRTHGEPSYTNAPASRGGQADTPTHFRDQRTSPRSKGSDMASGRIDKIPPSISTHHPDSSPFVRNGPVPSLPEHGSPSQPRYSATSQVRSPAAPQPVRPADMARQEHVIIDLEDTSAREYPSRPPTRNTARGRESPVPYIKPEPMSPPPRREHEPALIRRHPSPERMPRASSRASHYANRPLYDYHPVAPPGYHYPPPPPPYARHPYDPYAYRDMDPYAYPPIEYARQYPPAYPPPQAPSPYYPSRPVYDDYAVRYASRPPPPMRPPSRSGRRSASPPPSYTQPRRPSRSASPIRDRARERDSAPQSPNPRYKAMSMRPPSPLPRPGTAVYGLADPATPYRRPEYYPQPYAPPPGRIPYYPERGAYYPGPPDRYIDDARAARAESALVPRETDVRGYRDRDYYPPPPVVRGPLHPPPAPYLPAPYPPPLEYSRASSRAPVARPPEPMEYQPRITNGYYDRASVMPESRDYASRRSDLPEDMRIPPLRHQSIRPEPAGMATYDERDHRQLRPSSVQPALDGERYPYVDTVPGPPPVPGYPDRPPYGERGDRVYERF